jgi:hypothetical protein
VVVHDPERRELRRRVVHRPLQLPDAAAVAAESGDGVRGAERAFLLGHSPVSRFRVSLGHSGPGQETALVRCSCRDTPCGLQLVRKWQPRRTAAGRGPIRERGDQVEEETQAVD